METKKKNGKDETTYFDPFTATMKSRLSELEDEEKIKLLISGKAPPPNIVVRYLVDKYREARAAYEVTDANVRNLETRLTELKNKRLVIQGGVNKYLDDIIHWLNDTEAKKPENSASEDESV